MNLKRNGGMGIFHGRGYITLIELMVNNLDKFDNDLTSRQWNHGFVPGGISAKWHFGVGEWWYFIQIIVYFGDETTDGKRQKLLGDKWEMARKVEKFARHNMIFSAS